MYRILIFMNLCKGNRMELRLSIYYVLVCFFIYFVYIILLVIGFLGSFNIVDFIILQYGVNISEFFKVFFCCCNGDVVWDLGKSLEDKVVFCFYCMILFLVFLI